MWGRYPGELKLALDIFEFTGKIPGLALANAVMFSSQEAIVLLGVLQRRGSDPAAYPQAYGRKPDQVFQNKVKILVSHLKESDAAILGAVRWFGYEIRIPGSVIRRPAPGWK